MLNLNRVTFLSSCILFSVVSAYEYKSIYNSGDKIGFFYPDSTTMSIVSKTLYNGKFVGDYRIYFTSGGNWDYSQNMLIFIPNGTKHHQFIFSRVSSIGSINGFISLNKIPDPVNFKRYNELSVEKNTSNLLEHFLNGTTIKYEAQTALNIRTDDFSNGNYTDLNKWLYIKFVKSYNKNRSILPGGDSVSEAEIVSNTTNGCDENSLKYLSDSLTYILDKPYVDNIVGENNVSEACISKDISLQKVCTYLISYPIYQTNKSSVDSNLYSIGLFDPVNNLLPMNSDEINRDYGDCYVTKPTVTPTTTVKNFADNTDIDLSKDGWHLLGTSKELNLSTFKSNYLIDKNITAVFTYDNSGNKQETWTKNPTMIGKNYGFWIKTGDGNITLKDNNITEINLNQTGWHLFGNSDKEFNLSDFNNTNLTITKAYSYDNQNATWCILDNNKLNSSTPQCKENKIGKGYGSWINIKSIAPINNTSPNTENNITSPNTENNITSPNTENNITSSNTENNNTSSNTENNNTSSNS